MLRFKRIILLTGLLMTAAAAAIAQEPSGYGRFYALVIGNETYQHLSVLKTPKKDAEQVAKVLEEQYGFTVKILIDADRDQILQALSNLLSMMISEQDNLLIYYAGHGTLDKRNNVDYWQPIDAEEKNEVHWVPTSRITDTIRGIRAKHVLVVADSCYSGSLLRDSSVKLPSGISMDEYLRRMQQRPSRTALTSGGNEPVEDGGGSGHSIFAQALLEALRSNRDILDGHKLFDQIKRPVALVADQTPQYGDIRKAIQDVVLDPGDFLFVPKELQGAETAAASPNEKAVRDAVRRAGSEPIQNAAPQKGKTIGQYIDHGNGTITDTKTGLMWKRCSESLSGVDCEKGKWEDYKWDDAVKRFKHIEYAGYSDWRLPTIDELKTLVYCSKGKDKRGDGCNIESEMPMINQQAFPNIEAAVFWSGSPNADFSVSAWYVDFFTGHSNLESRDVSSAVRLVRGGQ